MILSLKDKEGNISCCSEPVKCCRSQSDIVNVSGLFMTAMFKHMIGTYFIVIFAVNLEGKNW